MYKSKYSILPVDARCTESSRKQKIITTRKATRPRQQRIRRNISYDGIGAVMHENFWDAASLGGPSLAGVAIEKFHASFSAAPNARSAFCFTCEWTHEGVLRGQCELLKYDAFKIFSRIWEFLGEVGMEESTSIGLKLRKETRFFEWTNLCNFNNKCLFQLEYSIIGWINQCMIGRIWTGMY